jgi:hypothetical protein
MSKEIEKILYADLAQIIEQGKSQLVKQVNSVLTLTYWHIGIKINEHILDNKRAEYGKQIVAPVARQLVDKFGNGFAEKNLRRMMQFASVFNDSQIVVTLSRQLSWSHFIELIPLKSNEAREYYVQKISEEM